MTNLANTVKDIKYYLDSNTNGLLREYFDRQLREIQRQWLQLMKLYNSCIIDRIQEWILGMCKKRSGVSNIDKLLLTKECKTNPNLCLTYADFSYSSIEPDMKILTSNKKNTNENINQKKPSSLSTEKKTFTSQTSLPSPTINDHINILLLGETGVGKSTFINVLVNYLKFKTFEQAQSNEPVILMPVSFLLATGDNFEERIMKFGDFASSNNEDSDHPGESITQNCKSYITSHT